MLSRDELCGIHVQNVASSEVESTASQPLP